ncbi:MAG: DUF4380 domain-containing protein [Planctomycetales bacterium]|nr:DUF4380 domain-containing protein [Planctomycetales bacterium]
MSLSRCNLFSGGRKWVLGVLLVGWLAGAVTTSCAQEGARIVSFYGYDDCIELRNATVEVVLCPAAGGRILKYAIAGKNILHLPAGDEGWTWDGETGSAPMNAGRFDIGPEKIVPRRPTLWQGRWQGEILGDRKAVMRSADDSSTGVRLERHFSLAESGSKLDCQQTIINISQDSVEYCHWSRTFVVGKGQCIVPLAKHSKFPSGYVRYDSGDTINFRPTDAHVTQFGNLLYITDRPENPKLGFDSTVGWLAYQSPSDLLFVKRFPTFPERAYNEVAGLTISVWYPAGDMVELEPIGPREHLEPGQSASFTESWYLKEHKSQGSTPESIAAAVEQL